MRLRGRLVLIGALLAAALSPSARAAAAPRPEAGSPTGTLESEVVAELNRARADPKAYGEMLRRLPGSGVTSEALEFLARQPARPAVTLDPRLAAAAARHATDQRGVAQVGHTGADGSRPRDRMQAQGVITTIYAELISVEQRRAPQVVAQMIVDPPGPAHPHRSDVFDPFLKVAGAGCGPNAKYGFICVIDLSAAPMAPSERASTAQAALPPSGSTAGHSVPDEVLIELAGPASAAPDALGALAARAHLELTDRFTSTLTGETLALLHIPDQRTPAAAAEALSREPGVLGAQPNFLFDLAQSADGEGPGGYAAKKLRLSEAHALARGERVLIGVVDSQVDATHPELKGAIAGSFDAVGGAARPDSHGTGVAALIAGHGRVMGSAPAARLLLARAFRQGGAAQGTSFTIVKAFDWAAAHGARVINMSFSGPRDPALHRELEAANRKGVVLVAAAGNGGPNSPAFYPAAEPMVIAVGATDAQDRPFAAASGGPHVSLAAPGVDLFAAAAAGAYQVSSGTSLSAAEVSGVVALMLQRRPALAPDEVRRTLTATARPLPSGGAALVDAYRATAAAGPPGR
jgi:uncharacterized protein YkwD